MSRYMPITGIDNNFPSLLIDTQAPIDVLHDTAAYRIYRADHAGEHSVYHPTGKGGRDIWGGGKEGREGKIKTE